MRKYRSIACGLAVLAAALVAVGGDMPFGYRSLGVDTYASGEPVRDGECYALVWVRNGVEFAGYNRDGSLVDPTDSAQVYVRAIAEGGRCPPVNFMVPEAFVEAHRDGAYRVVVLDTRCANGEPAGVDAETELKRVNGWGFAKVRRQASPKLALGAAGAASAASAEENLGSKVETAAKLPKSCRRPTITAFSFDADGNAVVECAGTEAYLTYQISMGATPAQAGDTAGGDRQDGNGTAEALRFTVGRDELKGAASGFMRVKAVTDL